MTCYMLDSPNERFYYCGNKNSDDVAKEHGYADFGDVFHFIPSVFPVTASILCTFLEHLHRIYSRYPNGAFLYP